MLWGDHLKSILEQQLALDALAVCIDGECHETMPAIIKASILMADKLLDSGRKNMFVFPEQRTCSFVFMLLRTLHDVSEGRIKREYNPYSFVLGEKLKFKNSVVEFVCVKTEKSSGIERIWVKTRSSMMGIVLETAPLLQHATTKRLSKESAFSKEYHQFLDDNAVDISRGLIQRLSDYKTHLSGATVLVAPILSTKKMLLESRLNEEKVSDTLLLAQSDHEGKIRNITPGQLSGIPAIVLCQDLYTVCKVMELGLEVKAVYIEATQALIDNQLDALDELILRNKSVVVLAGQTNFTDLSSLEARGFNIWTWNKNTIPLEICQGTSRLDVMARNSVTKKIKYVDVQCREISDSISLLFKNKRLMESQSAAVIQTFQDLFEVALVALRAVSPLINETRMLGILDKCKLTLGKEKGYLKQSLFDEMSVAVDNLASVYKPARALPKTNAIVEVLNNADTDVAYVVVPQNVDKNEVEQYLNNACLESGISIIIVHPSEYSQNKELSNGLTIVSGWLNKTVMDRILNANITSEVITLVYEVERRWENAYLLSNNKQLKHIDVMNTSVLKALGDCPVTDFEVARDEPLAGDIGKEDVNGFSELEDIELALSQNRYRRYISSTQENSVLTIPVSFVGDLIAFYRIGHILLTATKLINEDYDKTEETKPAEIKAGDFIIERETQRDIIRDIADMILKNKGCSDLREIARKWKEALEVEAVFSDSDLIYEKLKSVGCTRDRATVRNWLDDNNMITPLSKDDIVYIAKAVEDSVLLEMVDRVFGAGKIIKRAHIQAGHHLAEKLRTKLVEALSLKDNIDSFNVWQPIEIDIDGVGLVKLLKVIDVGCEVLVDAVSTNKLIDTNRIVT